MKAHYDPLPTPTPEQIHNQQLAQQALDNWFQSNPVTTHLIAPVKPVATFTNPVPHPQKPWYNRPVPADVVFILLLAILVSAACAYEFVPKISDVLNRAYSWFLVYVIGDIKHVYTVIRTKLKSLFTPKVTVIVPPVQQTPAPSVSAKSDTTTAPPAPPVDNAHVAPGCEQFSSSPAEPRSIGFHQPPPPGH